MYHELVKPLTNDEAQNPPIKIEKIEKEKNSIIIHPGVSKMSVIKKMVKTYSPEKWTELIKKLLEMGKKVYLAGGPDDKEYIEAICSNIDETTPNFTNYYGKTKNIMDLAKLIKSKEILICCDSAPMHIGVSVNTKVLAIFGATDEKKLIPNDEKFKAITNENCSCRPCLWDKRNTTCEKLECLAIPISKIINNL